jgi:hypothetical protein
MTGLHTHTNISQNYRHFHLYMCREERARLKIMNAQKYIRGSSNTFCEITMIEEFLSQ